MAALKFNAELKLAPQTLAAIDAGVLGAAEDGFRAHLGASLIGRKCERALWFSFRWTSKASFKARTLRLFARGHREEDVMASLLRKAGITLHQVDQSTGNQFQFSDCGGHFGGSMDGATVGVPEAPTTWHVWECKTSGSKAFASITATGVKNAKYEHWAQMQCYMHWTGMTRALYTVVNKDTDDLHIERVDYDAQAAVDLIAKAQRVIDAPLPPERIGGPDWYECKFCDHFAVCHGTAAPVVNCRSCAHSTPEGDGSWSCAKEEEKANGIPISFQKTGCEDHRFIPKVLEHWAAVVSVDTDQAVLYRHLATGSTFTNGPQPDGFLSREIHASNDKAGLGLVAADAEIMALRDAFGGEVVA